MRCACCGSSGPPRPGPCLSACLAQRPDFVWLYLLRGFAQQELQAWAAADADFQQAAQMPLDDNARYVLFVNRGVLRVRTDRFDEAIADLRSAIELKPGAYQAYVNLAQAYRRLGKLDLALDQLNRAVTARAGAGPPLPSASRGSIWSATSRSWPSRISTRRSHSRARTALPGRRPHRARPAPVWRARSTPRPWPRSTPPWRCKNDDAAAQRLRAEALFRLGRFEEVIDGVRPLPGERQAARVGLSRPRPGTGRAGPVRWRDRRFHQGAWNCIPPRPCRHFAAGRYLVVDAPKLALRDFELAIELDPKNGDAYSGRGFARAKLGRHRRGRSGCCGGSPPWADVPALAL